MTATGLILDLMQKGIQLEAHGDLLRFHPRSAVTPDLAKRMAAYKGELLVVLTGDSISPEMRRQIHAELIERVNAAYRGGPIDWPRLDDIEQRIWTAETEGEFVAAVAEYETVAVDTIYTGHIGQHK